MLSAGQLPDPPAPRGRNRLLAEAVQILTEAARSTWPGTDTEGQLIVGRTDWAEFVTLALAGAAANIGGIEAVLAGRPGSWEAEGVRRLLTSTVGHDEQQLMAHRTEPVIVDLYVEEILVDAGVWTAYDQAQQEINRRYEQAGLSAKDCAGQPLTEEQELQADELADLEERLEQLRRQYWAAYGQNLRFAVENAAASRPDLRVPVTVRVDLDSFHPEDREPDSVWSIIEQLRVEAISNTSLPHGGRSPLDRLRQDELDR